MAESQRHSSNTQRITSIVLMSCFLIQIFVPFVSAAGMSTCSFNSETCDDYSSADDATADQQDWVEGVYVFDLESTSSIEVQLTWAVREFNRSALGFDDPTINAALAADG